MPETRQCKCGNTFTRYDTIQKMCVPCALAKVRADNKPKRRKKTPAEKARQEFDRETRKRKKKLRENDLSHQKALTQSAVNKLVRLRDHDQPCISCGTMKPGIQYAAGHYKSAGGWPELRFNLKNISKQCNKNCNQQLSANIEGTRDTHGYKAGIIQRYGQARLDYLDGPHERIKYTCQDLIAFRNEVNKIIREMERGEPYREPSMYQDN